MSITATDPCPLCKSVRGIRIGEVSYAAIWHGLEQQWEARFSEPVRSRHTPAETAYLMECAECGLQHFTPHNPGDVEFYRELSLSPLYYAADKWEFRAVAERLCTDDKVLDVGCGDGAFLRTLHRRVSRSIGLDTNVEAVRRARAAGLDARSADVSEFAASYREEFDVVTSFHVLEHTVDVMPIVQSMRKCLRPGGRLIISVPYRHRILRPRHGIEALDCPPHHISRWEGRQLAMLAELAGLQLEELIYQEPDIHALRSHVKERLGGSPGSARTFLLSSIARVAVAAPLYRLYRALGWLNRPRLCWHAVVGIFRKPAAA